GTPLIASRAGALPEVTGDAALLVPPGDAEELSAALGDLLDDESARTRLASAGLARVRERFAWPAVAAPTEALSQKGIPMEPGCGPSTSRSFPSVPATACSTSAAARDGTPSRPTAAAPASWRPTST